MGAKLNQTHAKLAQINSALAEDKQNSAPVLQEAKKKKKFKAPKGRTRKEKKQQKNQVILHKGQEPVASKDGNLGVYTPPSERPKPAPIAPIAPAEPRTLKVVKPATPKPAAPAPKPAPAVSPVAIIKPVAAAKAAKKAAAAQEPTSNLGARKSLWDRIKGVVGKRRGEAGIQEPKKKQSLPRRAYGAFRRIAGIFKRKILREDAFITRTTLVLGLEEQRSSTTFKKCPKGAMISSKTLRHALPLNTFANPDAKNPTFPIRAGCRASKGGVLRALQKDMSGAGEGTVKQVLQRINSQGGTRGKDTLKGWGTGVGGKRMKTFRGPPHKAKRTKTLAKKLGISRKSASKLHGVSTGRADNIKHTRPYSPVGGAKGPSGNREVTRAGSHHAPKRKESNRKAKRRAASRATTIGKGKARIGH